MKRVQLSPRISPPRRSDGLARLQEMAAGSPAPPANKDAFADWVGERIRVDTANLSASTFKVDKVRKLPRKTTPAQALRDIPKQEDKSDTYKFVFEFYRRKLQQLVDGLRKNSKGWTDLKGVASSLNIDVSKASFDENKVVELLARLRALDMVERPKHP